MLSLEENQLVALAGQGTPMGEAIRRYCIPAVLSEELPAPDCPAVRVRLLRESLVAFRDTRGRVGVLEDACPEPAEGMQPALGRTPGRRGLLKAQEAASLYRVIPRVR